MRRGRPAQLLSEKPSGSLREMISRRICGRYLLGHLTYELGLAAARGIDMPAIAALSLDRIARGIGDTVYLLQRSRLDAVCIDRRAGSFPH
jgi:DNA-binding IclR family transcriptional regulator